MFVHTIITPPHRQHVDKDYVGMGRGGGEEEEDYSTNTAQNQQNDKLTFNEAKM